jgi:hypothetical protein
MMGTLFGAAELKLLQKTVAMRVPSRTLSPLEREAVQLAKDMLEQRALMAEHEIVINEIEARLAAGEMVDPDFVWMVYELYNSVLAQYMRNREVLSLLLDAIKP